MNEVKIDVSAVRPADPLEVADLPTVSSKFGLLQRAALVGGAVYGVQNLLGYGQMNLDPTTYDSGRVSFNASSEILISAFAISTVIARDGLRKHRTRKMFNQRQNIFEESFGIQQDSSVGSFDIVIAKTEKGKPNERHLFYTLPDTEEDEDIKIDNVAFILKNIARKSNCTHVVVNSEIAGETHNSTSLTDYVKNRLGLKAWQSRDNNERVTILNLEEIEAITRVEQVKIVETLVQKLKELDPVSSVVKFFEEHPLKSHEDYEKATEYLKIKIENRINEVYRNKPFDSFGNPITPRKIYTAASVRADGKQVKLNRNGYVFDTNNDPATLLGIDEDTITSVLNGSDIYATGKQITALELLLLRALNNDQEAEIAYETSDLEGHEPRNSLTNELYFSSLYFVGDFKRSRSWRRRFIGLAGLMLPIVVAGGIEVSQNAYYEKIKKEVAEELEVDPDKVRYEDVMAEARDNFAFRMYDDVASAYYELEPTLKSLVAENASAGESAEQYEEYRKSQLGAAQAGYLQSIPGNIYAGGKSVSLFELEVAGNENPQGFWAVSLSNSIYNSTGDQPVWFQDPSYLRVPYSELSEEGPLPSEPQGVENYIKVTSNREIQKEYIYLKDPRFKNVYSQQSNDDPETGIEFFPASEDIKVGFLPIPIKPGYRVIAAYDQEKPDVVFRTERTSNGIPLLVVPDDYEQRYGPSKLVYFVAKDTTGSTIRAIKRTRYDYPSDDYSSYSDIRKSAIEHWAKFSPQTIEGKTPKEIQAAMIEYIRNGTYSLTPIDEKKAEDGTDLDDIFEATLDGADRVALCNTANTVLALSSPIHLQPVSGFANSDMTEEQDGSGNFSISSPEGHMMTVDENGVFYDATPTTGDIHNDFFTEDSKKQQEKNKEEQQDKRKNIAIGAVSLLAAFTFRRKIRSAVKSTVLLNRLGLAEAYDKSGKLAMVYTLENHRLYSPDPNGQIFYGPTPSPDIMREFIKITTGAGSSPSAVAQAKIYSKL